MRILLLLINIININIIFREKNVNYFKLKKLN